MDGQHLRCPELGQEEVSRLPAGKFCYLERKPRQNLVAKTTSSVYSCKNSNFCVHAEDLFFLN